jgi:hypothetical protein
MDAFRGRHPPVQIPLVVMTSSRVRNSALTGGKLEPRLAGELLRGRPQSMMKRLPPTTTTVLSPGLSARVSVRMRAKKSWPLGAGICASGDEPTRAATAAVTPAKPATHPR